MRVATETRREIASKQGPEQSSLHALVEFRGGNRGTFRSETELDGRTCERLLALRKLCLRDCIKDSVPARLCDFNLIQLFPRELS